MKNIRKNTSTSVAGIYCIINLTNSKIYVGSSFEICKRIQIHLCLLRNQKHHCKHLQRSFNKYGEDSFYSFVLESCSKEILEEREEFWINKLNADYNKVFTNLSRPGLSLSEEARKNISEGVKKAHLTDSYDYKYTKIYVYDLEGNYLRMYNSRNECSADLNVNKSVIYTCLVGKVRQGKGYQFKYEYSEKIDAVRKAHDYTEEHRQRLSNQMKNNKFNVGKVRSDDVRKRISETLKSKKFK